MKTHDDARAAFHAWEAAKPTDLFSADAFFQAVLRHHLGAAGLAAEAPALAAFGQACAGPLDALARETNRDEHLPALRRWDAHGRRTEAVVFHPGYDVLGEAVYATGVMARYATPGHETAQLAVAYLFGQLGEAGHLCPLACTAGLIKILQHAATPEVAARCLPGLLRTDRNHPAHLHGAQFLTEVQGGSDVGANACVARPGPDGAWLISGEKWFCSVIDADLYLMTARPEGAPAGTRGLGAFVVPRVRPDGTPNGVYVRRLKYKLGTRSMASGEADFVDALAWPVALDGGFKAVVEIVLNTSRLYNAVASCGMLRRAQIEATTYAAHRRAFGQPIDQFPLVRQSLDRLRIEAEAAVAGTFALARLADGLALGTAAPHHGALYRLVVNMNKYWTSYQGTSMCREAIEVLGGNGAIEDFSVLPRLLRDAIVCEQWEGTHNVLCAQVLKDLHRYQLHTALFTHADAALAAAAHSPHAPAVAARVAEDRRQVAALLALPADAASLAIRPLVTRLAQSWQALCLLELAADGVASPALADRLAG